MAVMRRGFAAEQAAAINPIALQIFYSPVLHQGQKRLGVTVPITTLLLIPIKHVLRGRELQRVFVVQSAKLFREIPQIFTLCEPGELRDII